MKLSLRGLSKSYGWIRQPALVDVNLEIPAGQIVAIVGANGAGKTTLLRLLSTLAVPTHGEILVDGERLHRDRIDLRKRLFFLADTPVMFDNKWIAGHVAAVLRIYERDTADLAAQAADYLADFEILPMIEKQVGRLSRGERYKAALTAMFLADCELWLIDEPFTSGIDPLGQAVLRKQMRAAADRGRTVMFSTQILQIAEQIADRVCVLHQGRVHAYDTIASLTKTADHSDLESILSALRAGDFSDEYS